MPATAKRAPAITAVDICAKIGDDYIRTPDHAPVTASLESWYAWASARCPEGHGVRLTVADDNRFVRIAFPRS